MSFLNPLALLWALLAIPVVVLYLLRVRVRRVPMATTMFWEQAFEEKQPRALWRQLRHLTSLLLQLLFLACVVFALADPIFDSSVQQQQRTVVVLDTSASMQAVDSSGTSVFLKAGGYVQQQIAGLRYGDEMAFVVTGNQAQVACGLTTHPRTLQTALDQISVTDSIGQAADAIDLARRLLAGHPRGQILLVTDGHDDSTQLLAEQADVSVWQPDAVTGNVAITQFQVRRSLLDPVSFQVLVEVANFRDTPIDITVDLRLNDALLDVLPLSLNGGEIRTEVVEQTGNAGGVLVASMSSDVSDVLDVDNRAWAVLPDREPVPVVLVTAGNWFLQQALEAIDVVQLTVLDQAPAVLSPGTVLVLDGSVPSQVPSGPVLMIRPQTDTDLFDVSGTVQQPLVGKQSGSSRLLQHVQLDNVLMPEAVSIQPTADHELLIEAVSGEPLYVRFPRSQGDAVVLTIDLNQGDLPLRTAFPILLTNLLTWFSGDAELPPTVTAGTAMPVQVPAVMTAAESSLARPLRLTAPSGKVEFVSLENSTAVLPPLAETGIWTLQAGSEVADSNSNSEAAVSEAPVLIACNLANAEESRLKPQSESSPPLSSTVTRSGGKPLWFYAALIAVLLLITEWFLFQRRWIE